MLRRRLHRAAQRQKPLKPFAILPVDLMLLRGTRMKRNNRFGIRTELAAIETSARTFPRGLRFYGLVTDRAAHEIASCSGNSNTPAREKFLSAGRIEGRRVVEGLAC